MSDIQFKGGFTLDGITLPITPLIVTQKFGAFLDSKKLTNQMEKQIGRRKNPAFVDSVFQAMMEKVGWQSGQMWCAYYVKVVLMQMFSFDREWLSKKIGGGAYTNFVLVTNYNKEGDNRYIATTEPPQVGDVFCLKKYDKSGYGHTGLVLEVIDGYKVKTIEGNTSLKGVREGEGVFSLTRDLTIGSNSLGQKVIGFIRRNFTEDELKKLNYDEANQTFVFTQPKKTFYLDPLNTAQK